ncbi:ABC transporter substrate-binding protein [Palleronia rufa]|uniref:ABC transporter substrate-binding protein n=1 Tax=Palleronia rufa TaxID=1530186 RepID=UPI00055CAF2A|nr:ABC transporter substrate-binding protein [Palleronia rufa]
MTGSPDRIHPAARMHADEFRAGRISRREFLTRATALGVTATAAYGLIGAARPALAQGATPEQGGTLRIQQEIIALKDPRLWDWTEIGNFGRTWLEYLIEYNRDGTFRGMLAESWEVNDDATEFVFRLRPNVTWSNGDAFTAEDVVHNFRRWSDASVEGNSMATRMGNLVDPDTSALREGAVTAEDDLTVRVVLPTPDITLIASLSDYPAAITHRSYGGGDIMEDPIGTGPYRPVSYEVGIRGVVERSETPWWGTDVYGGPYLDRIEYIDYGTDPAASLSAIEAGEVDMLYESVGEFIEIMDSLDLQKSEAITSNTLVIRTNQKAEVDGRTPYGEAAVRRALAMAVDNSVLLELGYSGLGTVAENHHVSPIHPEYAPVDRLPYDPDQARTILEEAGMGDYTHTLVSLDDGYQRDTCDAVAAQLRDAGINVERQILPGSTYWNDWLKFPFSATEWNGRPLGVQVLGLAYRSGVPWNESGYASDEFDDLLTQANGIADADTRSEVMAKIEKLMLQDGVIIQPYWRSTFRHSVPNLLGAEMHPAFEIHPYKLGFAS